MGNGASASAAPLPLLEHDAAIPHLLFVLHLPVMLLILVLFRVFIHAACKTGNFRRWYGRGPWREARRWPVNFRRFGAAFSVNNAMKS